MLFCLLYPDRPIFRKYIGTYSNWAWLHCYIHSEKSLLAKIQNQNTNVSLLFIRMWKDSCGGKKSLLCAHHLFTSGNFIRSLLECTKKNNVLRKLEKIRHIVIVKGFRVGGVCTQKTILIWKIKYWYDQIITLNKHEK